MNFIIYVIINAITPGPSNILALNTVTNFGLSKGKRLFYGIFAGYYVVQIICAIFVYALNELFPTILGVLKYIGAAYILWLAIHILRSKPECENSQKATSFWKGFLLQFLNVKIYLFGITALTGFIVAHYKSFGALLLSELFIATVGTLATLIWIFLGNRFKNVYINHFHVINIILAVLLVECAVKMVL